MIARIFIPILLAIVLPDLYFDIRYLRRKLEDKWGLRFLWWLPTLIMVTYTVSLASIRDFAPTDLRLLNVYLSIVGLVVLPKMVFAICSATGYAIMRYTHSHKNYGNGIGGLLVPLLWAMFVYGAFIGPRQLHVKHTTLYFKSLPAAFDGYRITQFSDMHVGTHHYYNHDFPQRVVDSIMAQHSDLIVFTGDLQNIRPDEITEFKPVLSQLHAKDTVISILGNHDYSQYIGGQTYEKITSEMNTQINERELGWLLLLNEHYTIHRGSDSIVIAGEENDGERPFPQRSDIETTLAGVGPHSFLIMLQHDPSAWQRNILPRTHAQLTLSGHTHGGQIKLFGSTALTIAGKKSDGLYIHDDRMLYVSPGVGGLVPFRIGIEPEINIFTLRKIK